eukprot:CAMPEP_0184492374 /NCGR_PEP_ID=MMETSP0113_2-20130426/23023_1 /TAXON_ID=91329 /ORGANISM="Norrisiella sphaerica, Strain BC52" /LENGTH=519 /DNA_ID=CAMNT_0026877123 /DNA_START=114 /DNA_END=1670 /DNA_ORIENTATION=+
MKYKAIRAVLMDIAALGANLCIADIVVTYLISKTYVGILMAHSDNITGFDFDERNMEMYSASDDGTIKIWPMPEGWPERIRDVVPINIFQHERTLLKGIHLLRKHRSNNDMIKIIFLVIAAKFNNPSNKTIALVAQGKNGKTTLIETRSSDVPTSLLASELSSTVEINSTSTLNLPFLLHVHCRNVHVPFGTCHSHPQHIEFRKIKRFPVWSDEEDESEDEVERNGSNPNVQERNGENAQKLECDVTKPVQMPILAADAANDSNDSPQQITWVLGHDSSARENRFLVRAPSSITDNAAGYSCIAVDVLSRRMAMLLLERDLTEKSSKPIFYLKTLYFDESGNASQEEVSELDLNEGGIIRISSNGLIAILETKTLPFDCSVEREFPLRNWSRVLVKQFKCHSRVAESSWIGGTAKFMEFTASGDNLGLVFYSTKIILYDSWTGVIISQVSLFPCPNILASSTLLLQNFEVLFQDQTSTISLLRKKKQCPRCGLSELFCIDVNGPADVTAFKFIPGGAAR